MNSQLEQLNPYPFEKLATLLEGCSPPIHLNLINLAIGEPQQATPPFIVSALAEALETGLKKYPTTKGGNPLREQIVTWLSQRFQLPLERLDAQQHVLPVNGTREALFAFAQCVINRETVEPLVLMPNPFYQIYEGATLLAGAKPYFINCVAENDFQPDFTAVPEAVWQKCQLLYLCSPHNPTGTVLDIPTLIDLIHKADKYDFVIAADECYSEIYFEHAVPPVSLLQACVAMERWDFKRCVIFHSLSKRSNAPGLRSGFVAGDAEILRDFLRYRTYHGCSMSLAVQAASVAAWKDEAHVQASRTLYQEKFAAVLDILSPVISVSLPTAGFYLWLKTPIADTLFARELFARKHVIVLPGSFLSRVAQGVNPGMNRVRIALVPPLGTCIEAAWRIRALIEDLS